MSLVSRADPKRAIISPTFNAGPPDIPEVTFNGTFLCVSAYTHDEYPVVHFDVEVIDITDIATNLSGKPTNGVLCQPITSSSIPNVCSPFQGSVSATNAIGSSEPLNFSFNTSTTGQGIFN